LNGFGCGALRVLSHLGFVTRVLGDAKCKGGRPGGVGMEGWRRFFPILPCRRGASMVRACV
jgi:hypothetical protein